MTVLIVAHMTGCPHCPPVQELCQKLRDRAPVMMLESQHALVRDMKVSSFPTVLLSTPEGLYEYNGQRIERKLRDWVDECA